MNHEDLIVYIQNVLYINNLLWDEQQFGELER